ncbi:MAG: sigma-54 dependent transcriptional regulator [Pirellulales bacterium]
MKKTSLLLVDDDRQLLESMSSWLRELDYDVTPATGQPGAVAAIDRRAFDLVLVDIRLQDGDGFEILAHARKKWPDMPVIMISGYGSVETAIEAIRAGAFDFLTKPLIDEELKMAIDRAITQRTVMEENQQLKAQLDMRYGMENIIGQEHHMRRIFDMIDSVADTRATVLVTGESGTGKSLIARALHRRSSRRDGPFIEVACGALPETLLESELFGHAAGAFTGAVGEKLGKFMQADGGTIFLDEISTASPALQVKLLRVLQELEFEQVGGTKTFKVDTRIILATNDDLAQCVSRGTFRQDLYYRVNVINITLPPLRERLGDIPLLAQTFLEKVREESGRAASGFTEEAMSALQRYRWPGNVRELENVVERAVLLGKGDRIDVQDLPSDISGGAAYTSSSSGTGRSLKEALEAPERRIILDMLESNGWNRNATADALGINRTTLYKKMKRLGLEEMASR